MSQHARPHLQTHTRSSGHSAVAGVAYRLGLRLYDRRTGQWHDFRRRKLGEEIVRAVTVAPPGAPEWATDPDELWNRAEAAEKRKDAQVARDYRIPIPFGLSDEQAGDMAEAMARYIADVLTTAVSMGLHRDADIDALGNVKTKEEQGYHAHLYFPTRKLEQMEGEEGNGALGLGSKLTMLSNKNSSGAFVEQLNAKWAELANRYTAEQGLTADYDHRSYARQDLPIQPQRTLGQAVTAMERKGFFTRRGAELRGDIILPSELAKAAQAIVLGAQRERAVADRQREAQVAAPAPSGTPPSAPPALSATAPAAHPPGRIVTTEGDTLEWQLVRTSQAPAAPSVGRQPAAGNPAPAGATTMEIGFIDGPPGSLLMRFRAAVPAPKEAEQHVVYAKVLRFVRLVERVLGVLKAWASRFRGHDEARGRRMAAKLDVVYRLDQTRAERAAAQERLREWEAAHPWRMRAARATGGDGKPTEWRILNHAIEAKQVRIHEMKSAMRSHDAQLEVFDQERSRLEHERGREVSRLRFLLRGIREASEEAMPSLLSVAEADEREWLKAATEAPEVMPPAAARAGRPLSLEPRRGPR